MTARNDVVPDWLDSPRVLEVAAPSTQFVVQDVVDTSRLLETRFQGMSYPHLINAAGKEDLGGGVQVGITATLQNAKIAFEGRTTPAQTGTVSTNPGSPVAGRDVFTDSSATFVTNNVQRGSLVINFTDQSIAEVVSVDSETQLTTKTLVNGIGNTYDVNDVYHVFNVTQCTALGGNLVAVDDVGGTISSVLPTAFTQILLTASSSATTQNQEALEAAAFQGGVAYKPGSGNVGTAFPNGTREFPLQSIMDVHAVSQARGLRKIFVMGDANLSAVTMDMSADQHLWIGDNRNITLTLSATGTFDTTNNGFEDITLSGHTGGNNSFEQCNILDGSTIGGHAISCSFSGETTLVGSLELVDCVSAEPGAGHPDFVVGSNTFQVSNWRRGLGIHSMSGGTHTIDQASGRLHLDVGCVGGTISYRGFPSAAPDDQSAGTVLNDETGTAYIWAYIIDGTFSAEEVLRLVASAAAAKASGLELLAPKYRDLADTKDRISATTDVNGNRLTITYNVTK